MDSYGHFREAKFSQIKLHWTWKLNFIYSKISKYRIDSLVILEEDHYLTVDALHVANTVIVPNIKSCESKNKICLGALGTYVKPTQKECSQKMFFIKLSIFYDFKLWPNFLIRFTPFFKMYINLDRFSGRGYRMVKVTLFFGKLLNRPRKLLISIWVV